MDSDRFKDRAMLVFVKPPARAGGSPIAPGQLSDAMAALVLTRADLGEVWTQEGEQDDLSVAEVSSVRAEEDQAPLVYTDRRVVARPPRSSAGPRADRARP